MIRMIKKAKELITKLKKKGFEPEEITTELIMKKIEHGPYKIFGYSVSPYGKHEIEEINILMPFEINSSPEKVLRLRKIAKELNLTYSSEFPHSHCLKDNGKPIAIIHGKYLQLNFEYEKAEKLLEKLKKFFY